MKRAGFRTCFSVPRQEAANPGTIRTLMGLAPPAAAANFPEDGIYLSIGLVKNGVAFAQRVFRSDDC